MLVQKNSSKNKNRGATLKPTKSPPMYDEQEIQSTTKPVAPSKQQTTNQQTEQIQPPQQQKTVTKEDIKEMESRITLFEDSINQSKEGLREMEKEKKKAALTEDFRRAAELKEEIDSARTTISKLEDQLEKTKNKMELLKKEINPSRSRFPTEKTNRRSKEIKETKRKSNPKEEEKQENYELKIDELEKELAKELAKIPHENSPSPPDSVRSSIHDPKKQKKKAQTLKLKTQKEVEKERLKALPQDSTIYLEARAGRTQNVLLLCQEGKDPDAVDFRTGATALHAAAENGNLEIIKVLIEHNSNLDAKNRKGQTPLHLSIAYRHDQVTEYLLEIGADPDIKDNTNITPFELSGKAPQYQLELKHKILQEQQKIKSRKQKQTDEHVKDAQEKISFFLHRENKITMNVNSETTANDIVAMVAAELELPQFQEYLEVVEDILKKQRILEFEEQILAVCYKWPNTNPEYCRFIVRMKRGTAGETQMKWKEKIFNFRSK